ncbi:hypothetical protein QQF64_016652 [Cirrhinus molitorella]|uniref:Uncharacterized protein n=1 Tax=Cirrhinus molitorella TaxID=172907 RepID=A0ABR3LNE9_9TELE
MWQNRLGEHRYSNRKQKGTSEQSQRGNVTWAIIHLQALQDNRITSKGKIKGEQQRASDSGEHVVVQLERAVLSEPTT